MPNTSSLFGIAHVWVYLKFILILFSSFHLNHVYISCRAPNPDTVLIMQTPLGVISTKSLLQTKKKKASRLISSKRIKVEETPPADNTEHEPLSAAWCRIFQRTNQTKQVGWRNFLFLFGIVCDIIFNQCNIVSSYIFMLFVQFIFLVKVLF